MRPKILIVDDHDDFRKTVREYLEKNNLGIEIFEAATAAMAVTKAACVKPRVILMDISLPGDNGFTAIKEIKRDNPECDVIILSMFEVDSFRKMAREVEAREFIGKSEVYEKLIPAIRKCLNGRIGPNTKGKENEHY